LLDESVPKALGFLIEGHFVRSVQFAGFAGFQNGELLAAMVEAGYKVRVSPIETEKKMLLKLVNKLGSPFQKCYDASQ
jgi:hypothetical protein